MLGLCLLSPGRVAGSTESKGPRHFYPNAIVFQEPEEECDGQRAHSTLETELRSPTAFPTVRADAIAEHKERFTEEETEAQKENRWPGSEAAFSSAVFLRLSWQQLDAEGPRCWL